MGGADSQDQCISSESDESFGKHEEGQIKPIFLLGNPEFGINPYQVDMNQSLARIPCAYADPYFSGLFGAYGPQSIPQMVGIACARVPLPPDLTEDGPIYVNAKQYHGILRRRQMRAKLEAQNKLVKNRKPYLHKSRHIHAMNRVRGSGGRFVSTKNTQTPDSNLPSSLNCALDSANFYDKGAILKFEVHQSETREYHVSGTSSSGITTSNDAVCQQPDHRISARSSHVGVAMQGRGGLMGGGLHRCARVFQ